MRERLLCKQEVVGSIPITSTTERAKLVSRCDSGALAPREHRLNDAERRSCRGATAVRLHRESAARGSRDRSGKASLPMGVSSWVFDL